MITEFETKLAKSCICISIIFTLLSVNHHNKCWNKEHQNDCHYDFDKYFTEKSCLNCTWQQKSI
jgi:hypothetical protein